MKNTIKKDMVAGELSGRDLTNQSNTGASLKKESIDKNIKSLKRCHSCNRKLKNGICEDCELLEKATRTVIDKYGSNKHTELVTVHSKNKTFIRKQIVGVSKKKSVVKESQWFDEYKKYQLNKYPIGIDKDKVNVNLLGDVNSHWILSWKNPKSGKQETSYSKEFMQRNAENKWNRIQNITSKDIELIKGKTNKLLKSVDLTEKEKDSIAIISIIANTGLRPGDKLGFKNTGNRGVSTLGIENINIIGDKIKFNFTGKSYKENVSEIKNKVLADYILNKIKNHKGGEFIFNSSKAEITSTYKDVLGMSEFKLKDMRTYVATDMATKILMKDETAPPPLPKKKSDIRKLIQKKLTSVFEKVSQKLNNSPAMAKNSYIHPAVIDAYLLKIGIPKEFLKGEQIEEVELTLDEIIKESKDYYKNKELYDLNSDDEDNCDYFNLPKWWAN